MVPPAETAYNVVKKDSFFHLQQYNSSAIHAHSFSGFLKEAADRFILKRPLDFH
jgi:hypothetical protein